MVLFIGKRGYLQLLQTLQFLNEEMLISSGELAPPPPAKYFGPPGSSLQTIPIKRYLRKVIKKKGNSNKYDFIQSIN